MLLYERMGARSDAETRMCLLLTRKYMAFVLHPSHRHRRLLETLRTFNVTPGGQVRKGKSRCDS